jgi:hypothetical protein
LTGRERGTTVEARTFLPPPRQAKTHSQASRRPHVVNAALLILAVAGVMLVFGAERAEAVPTLIAECTPAPVDCDEGWYTSDVFIDWTVLPPSATVLAGCKDRWLTTDTPESVEFCSARDGSTVTVEVPIKVDKTPPVVTGGQPARGADFNGWYNHPVAVAFSGRDLTSGLASCTAPTYAGPDSGAASLFGTCMDIAGNVSSPFPYGLSYDATAPTIAGIKAAAGDRRAAVRWKTTAEAAAVEVIRTPGLGSETASVVFRGPGRKFVDTGVANRKRYLYEVRVRDAAGNAADRTVSVVPHPHLVSPIRLAVTRPGHPPLLRWTPVRRARYYNVQLFRNGRKILSAWPEKARFRLKKRWRYDGLRRRLEPARYRWAVWPGYGPRSKSDYGKRLGPASFRVSRR